jgi:hypothetical protein
MDEKYALCTECWNFCQILELVPEVCKCGSSVKFVGTAEELRLTRPNFYPEYDKSDRPRYSWRPLDISITLKEKEELLVQMEASSDLNELFELFKKYVNVTFYADSGEAGKHGVLKFLLHPATGVSEEAGEVLGEANKAVFHDKPVKVEKYVNELGDLTYYEVALMSFLGIGMKEVMVGNVRKLNERFPDGRPNKYDPEKHKLTR